jgi:hypothetical protein
VVRAGVLRTLRRLAVAEAQVFAHEMEKAYKLDKDSPIGHAFCLSDRTLSRLQRMVNSTQRNFRDALRSIASKEERFAPLH